MDFPLAWNAEYIDFRYRLWKADPDSVSKDWQIFFTGFELAGFPGGEDAGICGVAELLKQCGVQELIHRYRDLGHLLACVDPLVSCPTTHPLLDLPAFDLDEEDLDRAFYAPHFSKQDRMPLRDILRAMKETYCRSVGVEYMHIQDPSEREWLQERMESTRNRPGLEKDEKLRLLRKIVQATLFEQFLHTRYVGQKRFSVEGAEVVVAALDALVQHAAGFGCREIVMGMAHRGRLNVLVNVLEKLYEDVFCEFEDNYDPRSLYGAGDVKYHIGYLGDVNTIHGRPVRILLASNPSHLEAVDPVVEGIARARQEQYGPEGTRLLLPVLIHGDAAFAGQGIVSETLNLSRLDGYDTGGTIHVVINNQIGFTTLPEHARSTRYSTDIAKMLMVPIFHVHGEDPEAAAGIVKLAFDYRMRFAKDVVIDVVCYRRYGHNEGDEPYYTQPQMYSRIKERPTLERLYTEKLFEEGLLSQGELDREKEGINQCLENAFRAAREKTCPAPVSRYYENVVSGAAYSHVPVPTGVPAGTLLALARKLNELPPGFTMHQRLKRVLDRRLEAVEKGEGIDWATAEALAFASLLVEGVPIRLSGQDSQRGTFSQRHSVITDVETGEHYVPLNSAAENQARFSVHDSMLSELAVLGFEYGYSLVSHHALVIWEAQFGDFANNAQVIVDQFISSAESKWQRLSGLVLLLPHGFEGQGPEHSSARFERYLQLCAQDNMEVCYPSTPAQYFHLLRRQVLRAFRKPVFIMTPKSLLRHPMAASKLSDMASGSFQQVLDDATDAASPRRVILCSGKIYYELVERRGESRAADTAIVRMEQLYPFPLERMKEIAAKFAGAEEWIWVQEEPENMGAWEFMRPRLQALAGKPVGYIGRSPAPTPATGHLRTHRGEQSSIIDMALGRAEVR